MNHCADFNLTFHIQSEWHLGSGREGGAYADNLVNKDNQGLPQLNGKSVKGLLRHACREALSYGWLPDATHEDIERLFGTEGTGLDAQGAIQVGSATLSPAERAWFAQDPRSARHLFRVHHSTAIDHDTGTAKEGSLRSMEVVVPMTLTAPLKVWSAQPEQAADYQRWLETALPLVCALGGKRRRGMGEVTVTIAPQEAN